MFYRLLMRAPVAGLLLAVCGTLYAAAPAVAVNGPRRASFNDGWRFFLGDAAGAEQVNFQDSSWTALRLPHDWAIDGPFDSKRNPHTGALPIDGVGWYRKAFTVPDAGRGRFYSIEFDGAMNHAQVWLNGKLLGGRPYGYIGFAFDLTPHLRYGGQENVIAVKLAPPDRGSRWYPGAGIYRNVWLDVTASAQVARWGTYVTTPIVTDLSATVNVKTEVLNRGGNQEILTLVSSVLDAAGKVVASRSENVMVSPNASKTADTNITVPNPKRWSMESPTLYTLVSEVKLTGKLVDRYETPFGIRTIQFDKAQGFLLNGKRVKLQGVCLHHDLGALGAAVNRRATERQLEIMKSAGVNAIRTSHNPPSPELLEFADKMGMVVMDEAFDMWRIHKTPNDYATDFAEWSERDIKDMVQRDRNHPSVIMWSIGNEIPEQGRANGAEEARRLVKFVKEMDATRPTTSAFNNWQGAIKNKLADEVDLPGFNYQPMRYEEILKEHPNWIIYGSETASCVSSRGVYHLPIEKYEKHPSLSLSAYGIIAPSWAYCPDVEFTYQDKLPNVLGEFVWTGFDYIGEPTPYFAGRNSQADWPARSSYFGFVDLAGFPKDTFYLYQAQWTKKPMVHVLPHWNWAGREGQKIPVMAFSNAEEVELFVNGVSQGKKRRGAEPWTMPVGPNVTPDRKIKTPYRFVWDAAYAPGSIKVVAYNQAKPVATDEVKTAGAAARISLVADRAAIRADGDDLSFITVRVEDQNGNLVPGAENLIKFDISGAGVIQAVDNGNSATEEPFHARQRKAYSGMALLIVRSTNQPGTVQVTATSEGLNGARLQLATRK